MRRDGGLAVGLGEDSALSLSRLLLPFRSLLCLLVGKVGLLYLFLSCLPLGGWGKPGTSRSPVRPRIWVGSVVQSGRAAWNRVAELSLSISLEELIRFSLQELARGWGKCGI